METAYAKIAGVAAAPALRVSEAKAPDEVMEVAPFTSVAGDEAIYTNAGGPIWAMDWLVEGVGPAYLALGVHPTNADGSVSDHTYDQKYSGENVIQVWSMPKQHPETMAWTVGLRHDGGFAWDVQWNKHREHLPSEWQSGVGLLAAALADGRIVLYHVPKNTTEPILDLAPFCSTTRDHSVTLALRWSLVNPFQFLSGACDGSIQLWSIADAPTLTPLRRFDAVDTVCKLPSLGWGAGWVAVRDIAWCPYDPYIFATVGNDSMLRIWDVREPRACIRAHRLQGLTWALSVQWSSNCLLQVSGDQGCVLSFHLYSGTSTAVTWHPQVDSPVWQLGYSEELNERTIIASCCAAGTVRYILGLAPHVKRKRVPSVQLAQWTRPSDGHIHVDFAQRLAPEPNMSTKEKRTFPHRDVAIHRLAFGPIASHWQHSLVFGGHRGLLVLRQYPPDAFGKPSAFRLHKPVLGRPRKHPATERKKTGVRGRPRKATKAVVDDDDDDASKATVSEGSEDEAASGTSQSELDTSDIADDDDSDEDAGKSKKAGKAPVVSVPKRVLGRPRKKVVKPPADADDDDGDDEQIAPVVAAAKPTKAAKKAKPTKSKAIASESAVVLKPPTILAKKPRGRPRKVVSAATATTAVATTTTPKGKGKRPAVRKPDAETPPIKTERQRSLLDFFETPTKPAAAAAGAPDSVVVHKKRGRPRKIVMPEPAPPATAADKNVATAPADEGVGAAATNEGVGAAATGVAVAETTHSFLMLQPSDAAMPKRRGRPPKHDVTEPVVKLPRGRPRKNPIEDEMPKRPRGRPPKRPAPVLTGKDDGASTDTATPAPSPTQASAATEAPTQPSTVVATEPRTKKPPAAKKPPMRRPDDDETPIKQEPMTRRSRMRGDDAPDLEAPVAWVKGSVVHVLPRTWAGMNKLGGTGRITSLNDDGSVNVKYVLGGQDKNVRKEFITSTAAAAAPPDDANKRRRLD
ncbi:hypothetical protein SDRG_06138 [Saprolegnia diclina VS20]|uniref:Uncharacterized protein n=1 Tax=Saprolegnia diclina (strain VS20) TaxID=1156394 RepID=T0QFH8_SAPDV|nr:hypothetical protein SDRG_06138 [Saprolegnia diclina VS20]EQC36704.1 hypothetical protein SDRG_06138 [Saprolegnia diclina VS20]|eukprot:XP_008610125.1 hypothetical protein SDRG_06138 [Saprolegnia diclina VS20]